jgi:hypothetical protein
VPGLGRLTLCRKRLSILVATEIDDCAPRRTYVVVGWKIEYEEKGKRLIMGSHERYSAPVQ